MRHVFARQSAKDTSGNKKDPSGVDIPGGKTYSPGVNIAVSSLNESGESGALCGVLRAGAHMPAISRRNLIAGGAAIPLVPRGELAVQRPSRERQQSSAIVLDPVVAKVAAWIADRDLIDAKMREWQDQEVALCKKIKTLGMSLTRAYRCGLPEAREMRALDLQIKSGLKRLERNARKIVLMRVSSAEGALAKIRLGLRIQGPYDWEDYAYALAQDGCEELALALAEVTRAHDSTRV